MAGIVVPVSAATSTTVHFRTRLVHSERTPARILAIQTGNGFFRFVVVRHFHETKAARSSSGTVGHNSRTFNRSKRREQGAQLVFGKAKGKITYKNLLHGSPLLAFEIGSQQK